ncbi:MAG: ACT domain-containing protein [Clostridiales bacterium]
MKAIITVIGKDKIGIIYSISKVLKDNNINILDINQTIMQDIFTMVMLVDLEKMKEDFNELSKILDVVGEEIGTNIRIQREDLFNSMHRI